MKTLTPYTKERNPKRDLSSIALLVGELDHRVKNLLATVQARREAELLLDELGSHVSPDAVVGDLKVADQQEVEIARALSYNPAVFIMDEPSSALSRVEIDNLYGLVRRLKQRGVAIVYISHKLEEVFALADPRCVEHDISDIAIFTKETDRPVIPFELHEMAGIRIATTMREDCEDPGRPCLRSFTKRKQHP